MAKLFYLVTLSLLAFLGVVVGIGLRALRDGRREVLPSLLAALGLALGIFVTATVHGPLRDVSRASRRALLLHLRGATSSGVTPWR
ncbi:MAG: hypothetical protein FJ095_16290 [Deltaproteobacteria bacterium]|nr:hypothetical protein [Deltaproteobacteria bacterium]